MMTITDLYRAMQTDGRLQKSWEKNQPRVDRAFEAPLIARTPREVATAALLVIKLHCLPDRHDYLDVRHDDDLLTFARSQGAGGTRLANIISGKTKADETAHAAAVHTASYYRDRSAANELVRAPWLEAALCKLTNADPSQIISPALRPTYSERKARAVIKLAALLCEGGSQAGSGEAFRTRLRSIEGLGPERADAVGVFAFHQPWPITDSYLWRLLARHGVIDEEVGSIKSYDGRQKAFASHWQDLQQATGTDANQLAATLYLWADEAERYGFTYS